MDRSRLAVSGRAFVASEAFTLVVLTLFVLAAVTVAAADSRRAAGLAGSMANLKKFGEITGNYAADYENLFWTFSWRAGDSFSQWDDLNDASSDARAAANQAADIIRRRYSPDFPKIDGWLPHIRASSLVLADYLDEPLPMSWVASPADEWLLRRQDDPQCCGGNGWNTWLRAFWSSYEMPTAFVSPDEEPTIRQGGAHSSYLMPADVQLGGRRTDEVAFPSQKAHLSESAARFFGPRVTWYLYEEARVPLLLVDGSVSVRRTSDSNHGWNPASPTNEKIFILYGPSQEEPPTLSGAPSETVEGHYRWTRRGLKGVDFGGERVE